MTRKVAPPGENGLLATLPPRERSALYRRYESVELNIRQVLFKAGATIDAAYFPERGMISLVQNMEDGSAVEVGLIGTEGFFGVPLVLGARSAPVEAMVQGAGTALRIEDRAAEYEAWLDALVDEYEVVVAPYPEVAAKELVTESYKGTKPFKASGDGYKDYLVWKTIVAQISQQSGDHESYFLTNNIADFCEENSGQFTLHPDLAKQIATEACRPIVYRSLEKFLTDKIAPRLEGINIANVPNLSTDGIHDRVQEVLENELEWYGAFGFEGLHFNNDVTVGMVGEAAIEEISLKELDEKDLIITVTGIVPIECYGYLDKSDYYSMNDDDSEEVHISEPDWNDHVMQVSQSITTPFEILFSYSKSDNAITGHSIEFPAEIENDWDK